MLRIILVFLFIVVSYPVYANPCSTDLRPKTYDTISYFQLCYSSYFSLFNPETKTPKYVIEILKERDKFVETSDADSNRYFKQELKLPSQYSPSSSNYVNSGYSKGHLAPAGNYNKGTTEYTDTFYMSNVVPQMQRCNNSGVWLQIENHIRNISKKGVDIYVTTGPVYDDDHTYIMNSIEIPDMLFKVVYDYNTHSPIVGFLIPNIELCGSSLYDFIVPIFKIEEMTGLKFK